MSTNALTTAARSATNLPAELRDIVDPVPITSLVRELIFWGGVVAVLALILALLAWWRRRRRRAALAVPAGPPPPPPHERARRRLEAALQLISDPDRFCTEVSAALRVYLEDRFGWNAPDRTTEEFLAELRMIHEPMRSPAGGSPSRLDAQSEAAKVLLREPLEAFLTRCDIVKFARYEPTETELRDLQRAALRVVDDTVPPPVPSPIQPAPVETPE